MDITDAKYLTVEVDENSADAYIWWDAEPHYDPELGWVNIEYPDVLWDCEISRRINKAFEVDLIRDNEEHLKLDLSKIPESLDPDDQKEWVILEIKTILVVSEIRNILNSYGDKD